MGQVQLSVIIPAYNAARTIGECLTSVLSQEGAPTFEVIVIDDGSVDKTAEIVERNFPSIRLLYKENGGPGSARNFGVNQARGRIVVFLDADDTMLPGRLAFQGGYMLAHPEIALTFGKEARDNGSGKDARRGSQIPTAEEFTVETNAYVRLVVDGNFISNTTTAVWRNAYLEHGLQPEQFFVSEDYAMNLALARHYPIAGTRRELSWYRTSSGTNLMCSSHAYVGPVMVLGDQLTLYSNLLSNEEYLIALARWERMADMLLRNDWIENGRRRVTNRLTLIAALLPYRLHFKWRFISLAPPVLGRLLRGAKRSLLKTR